MKGEVRKCSDGGEIAEFISVVIEIQGENEEEGD